jgi:hypothetical protein
LEERFVAVALGRAVAELAVVNPTAAAFYLHRLRQIMVRASEDGGAAFRCCMALGQPNRVMGL